MLITYVTEFFVNCPTNGIRIKYLLEIETSAAIPVEQILAAVSSLDEVYHEEAAARLALLGGKQTLTAEHHGVQIKTVTPDKKEWLDQAAGGMSGTPGY